LSNNSGTFQRHSKNYQSHFWPLGTKWPRSKNHFFVEVKVRYNMNVISRQWLITWRTLSFNFKKKRGVLDYVHVVDEIVEKEPPKGEGKYVEWDSNITTCILDVDSYSFCANDYQPVKNTTKQVKWKLSFNSICVVKHNLVESPTQQQTFWYFNLSANHHVHGNPIVFALFQ
jgi:hypothetical protein